MGRKQINLTGKEFGRLTAIKAVGNDKWKSIRWFCVCSCGKEVIVNGGDLRSGYTKSCGCLRMLNLVGEKFGRLTVKKFVGINNVSGNTKWLCKCECGNEKVVQARHLRSGGIKSCGCLDRDRKTVHGLNKHSLYPTWNGMLSRCYNNTSASYKNYGQRGISVCDRWWSVKAFIDDIERLLGPRPTGCSLDRINNDGNYEPNNVRWANSVEQGQNKRINRNNTSTHTGVYRDKKQNKWKAAITYNGKYIHLGHFSDFTEAVKVREKAEKELWR